MWQSLWDIYSGEGADAGKPRVAPERSPPRHRVAGAKRGTPRAGVAAPPGRGVGYDGGAGGRSITLQTSLHSTSSGSSGGKRQVKTPTPSSGNTTILRGVIVGEEKSGKTCLILRLRGEDPFQSTSQRQSNGSQGKADRSGRRNLMALIPWKLPEDDASFHHPSNTEPEEPVQLYVSEAKSFCYLDEERPFQNQWASALQPHRGKGYNFVVWVIDPRMENVLEYIRLGLDTLFPPETQRGNETDGEAAAQRNAKHPLLVQHVCILLNFRDLNDAKQPEEKRSLVDDVHRVADQVMERCQKQNANPDTAAPTPTILVYESSMKNCYGLQNLHSFITLPYLSQKERELRWRAEMARKQQLQWKQGLMGAKVVQYSEFVEQTIAKQGRHQRKESTERQRLEEEKHKLQLRLQKQNELLRAKGVRVSAREETPTAKESNAAPSDRSERDSKGETPPVPVNERGQRKLFAKSEQKSNQQHPVPAAAAPVPVIKEHHNLESFFSDDDDDGDDIADSVAEDSSESSGDDDSDEGDFFIDVSGTRCAHANGLPSTPKHKKLSKQKRMQTQSSDLNAGSGIEAKVEREATSQDKREATGKRDDIDGSSSHGTCGDSADSSVAGQNEQPRATPDSDRVVEDADDEQSPPVEDGSAVEADSTDQPETQPNDASKDQNASEEANEKGRSLGSDDADDVEPNKAEQLPPDADDASKEERSKKSLAEATGREEAVGDGEDAKQELDAGTTSQTVMDYSDDESETAAPQEEERTGDRKESEGAENEEGSDEPTSTTDDSVPPAQQPHETLPPKPTAPAQNGTGSTVSSAALAAIEAAKREAEQMMAQSSSSKREKKSKKVKKRKKAKKKVRED